MKVPIKGIGKSRNRWSWMRFNGSSGDDEDDRGHEQNKRSLNNNRSLEQSNLSPSHKLVKHT